MFLSPMHHCKIDAMNSQYRKSSNVYIISNILAQDHQSRERELQIEQATPLFRKLSRHNGKTPAPCDPPTVQERVLKNKPQLAGAPY